jgi:hypothetical protein
VVLRVFILSIQETARVFILSIKACSLASQPVSQCYLQTRHATGTLQTLHDATSA